MSTTTRPMQETRTLVAPTIAVMAGAIFWLWTSGQDMTMPLSLVLTTQVVLFFLLFNRPVWAIASLMVGQLTSSGYMFSIAPDLDISIRFLWTILAVLLLVPVLRNQGEMKLGNSARRVLIPAIIFFVFATIANAVNTDMATTIKYSRQTVTSLVVLVLLPAVVNNKRDIKLLSIVALITCAISAAVAVMQHYNFQGLPVYTIYPDTFSQGRALGLTDSSLHLAYYLPVILMPMFAIYFIKGVSPNNRKLLAFLALVMVAALYFTYTRSGMYSLIPGFIALILLIKGPGKKELFLVALILVGAFVYYADTQSNRYSQWFADDTSAAARPVLWQAGVSIAMDNPLLGIKSIHFY